MFKKPKIFGGKDKGAKGSDADDTAKFEEQRVHYLNLRKNVETISHNVKKKYEKSVKGIVVPLQQLAAAVEKFYEDGKGEYARCGTQYVTSTELLVQCIGDFENEADSLMKDLDSYVEKINGAKKAISERDKLLTDYQNKKKTYTSLEKKRSQQGRSGQRKVPSSQRCL